MKTEEEKTKSNTLAGEATLLGLGKVSSYIWEACCQRYGVGGNPKAIWAYEKIMEVLISQLK